MKLSNYIIHEDGRVYSIKRSKFLKPNVDERGYERVALYINGKAKNYRVHRLVAEAYIPNLDNKPQVNHKNGVKTDNRVENLEWCTNAENQQHAWDNGLNVSTGKKPVLDTLTGVYYDSATELAEHIGMNKITLMCHLNGSRNVKTKYIYA
jgi:hypothetical protein